ncbi:triple tyrosine motif-containing protein [uncultured Bacteroides sp.]|uniref:helix-turn-helix and ligand-binding sensor domain-containing protein n=1 Tax=uncultured Bacteroides sp. TaxID=162156 RepID=UPI002AAAED18|nr:triple tyrosine motif-containing protein [uncultured Bacteroides sp.]
MKNRIILCIAVFQTIIYSAFSIHPIVRNFSRSTYKAGTQNWDIIQTNSNCVYFANNDGLLEFDGWKWSNYPIRNNTNIRSVMYDPDNRRIYAGAFNEFGYYALSKNGVMTYHSLIDKVPKLNKNFNEIWNIHKSDNSIYFQGNKEIFRYNNGSIKVFSFHNKIDCSALVYNSFIIASSEGGIYSLSGNLFVKFPCSKILKGKKVCAILPFAQHKILFVTDFNGLYLFDGEKIESYTTDINEFLKKSQVFCAATNGQQIAFGTVVNGLVVKGLSDNSTFYVNTFSGLQNNTILSITYDKQNNLWLGLDKGIDYVQVNSPVYSLFGSNNLYGAGYASLLKDNILYLGTNQGLYTTNYPIKNTPEPIKLSLISKIQGQVWCLYRVENTIFCGNDQGAYIINGTNIEKIPNVNGAWNFRLLKHAPGNTILGCSYEGLFILKEIGNRWKFLNFIKGFTESSGMYEEDDEGKIWFSHWVKGLFRLTLNKKLDHVIKIDHFGTKVGLPTNRNNTVFRFNNQLIFSSEYGFYFYNRKLNRMTPFNKINKYFPTQMNSMRLYETPMKDFFCVSGTFFGAAFANRNNTYTIDSLSFKYLRDKLIIGFENFNFIDKKNVLVSTEDGFSWIYLTRKNNSKNNYGKVFVKNIYVTNGCDSLVDGQRGDDPGTNIEHEFPFTDNSLRFEYIYPEFRNENAVTYSYYLENYDKGWSNYSSINVREYTKLKKGSYIFHLRAKNNFESVIAETSYKFTIRPPWYESQFAYICYFILLLVFLWGVVQFINMQSRKKAHEVEQQKEAELKEQQMRYKADSEEKENEIFALKNQSLQYTLRHKSQELASSTLNLIRKNEILQKINNDLNKINEDILGKQDMAKSMKLLEKVQDDIKQNIKHDNDWKRFEQNFDLVYEDYLKRLSERFPQLNVRDKKLCAYLRMDLCSKDIAPLLNMSVRSVEMTRYRLRKKMGIGRDVNLSELLQRI